MTATEEMAAEIIRNRARYGPSYASATAIRLRLGRSTRGISDQRPAASQTHPATASVLDREANSPDLQCLWNARPLRSRGDGWECWRRERKEPAE